MTQKEGRPQERKGTLRKRCLAAIRGDLMKVEMDDLEEELNRKARNERPVGCLICGFEERKWMKKRRQLRKKKQREKI